jgi:hypothetical protein
MSHITSTAVNAISPDGDEPIRRCMDGLSRRLRADGNFFICYMNIVHILNNLFMYLNLKSYVLYSRDKYEA